jgi:hypothetical protein
MNSNLIKLSYILKIALKKAYDIEENKWIFLYMVLNKVRYCLESNRVRRILFLAKKSYIICTKGKIYYLQ